MLNIEYADIRKDIGAGAIGSVKKSINKDTGLESKTVLLNSLVLEYLSFHHHNPLVGSTVPILKVVADDSSLLESKRSVV